MNIFPLFGLASLLFCERRVFCFWVYLVVVVVVVEEFSGCGTVRICGAVLLSDIMLRTADDWWCCVCVEKVIVIVIWRVRIRKEQLDKEGSLTFEFLLIILACGRCLLLLCTKLPLPLVPQ